MSRSSSRALVVTIFAVLATLLPPVQGYATVPTADAATSCPDAIDASRTPMLRLAQAEPGEVADLAADLVRVAAAARCGSGDLTVAEALIASAEKAGVSVQAGPLNLGEVVAELERTLDELVVLSQGGALTPGELDDLVESMLALNAGARAARAEAQKLGWTASWGIAWLGALEYAALLVVAETVPPAQQPAPGALGLTRRATFEALEAAEADYLKLLSQARIGRLSQYGVGTWHYPPPVPPNRPPVVPVITRSYMAWYNPAAPDSFGEDHFSKTDTCNSWEYAFSGHSLLDFVEIEVFGLKFDVVINGPCTGFNWEQHSAHRQAFEAFQAHRKKVLAQADPDLLVPAAQFRGGYSFVVNNRRGVPDLEETSGCLRADADTGARATNSPCWFPVPGRVVGDAEAADELWRHTPEGQLVNLASGLCLAAPTIAVDGSAAVVEECDPSEQPSRTQQWLQHPAGFFRNPFASNYCLDGTAQVRTALCVSGTASMIGGLDAPQGYKHSDGETDQLWHQVDVVPFGARVGGTGHGKVVPAVYDPDHPDPTKGSDCRDSCRNFVVPGTEVSLTAVPAEGSAFTGWSGACAGTEVTCRFTVADGVPGADGMATANFVPTSRVAVRSYGTGSGRVVSTPSGIDCGAGATACSARFRVGSEVSLTVEPSAGSRFATWFGGCTGAELSCTFTVGDPTEIDAVFTEVITNTLQVGVVGEGSVTSEPSGIECGTSCTHNFEHGQAVTLTAAPAPGQVFDGWSGGCNGRQPTCVVNIDGPKGVTAGFSPERSVTVAIDGAGTVTSTPAGIACPATCVRAFSRDEAVTLEAVPGPGQVFVGWSGDCSAATPRCVLPAGVAGAASLTAHFERGVELRVSTSGAGEGKVTSLAGIDCYPAFSGDEGCTTLVRAGTQVTLDATVSGASLFKGWSGACTGKQPACTVTVNGPTQVTAQFVRAQLLVIVLNAVGGLLDLLLGDLIGGLVDSLGLDCSQGGGTICVGWVELGVPINLAALPVVGQVFAGWGGEPPADTVAKRQVARAVAQACADEDCPSEEPDDTTTTCQSLELTCTLVPNDTTSLMMVMPKFVAAPVANLKPPTLSGDPQAGKDLTADPGRWAPADEVTVGYQWLRGEELVEGASSRTYRLTAADVGHQIRAVVVGSVPGAPPVVVGTAPAGTVRAASPVPPPPTQVKAKVRLTVAVPTRVRPGKRAWVRIAASSPGARPAGLVRIKVDGKVRATVRLNASRPLISIRLPKLRKGRHWVQAVYLGSPTHERGLSPRRRLVVR